MNVYLLNIVLVLALGIYQNNSYQYLSIRKRRYSISTAVSVFIVFLLMLIEMGLRGDFSIDTINYYYIYNFYINASNHDAFLGQRDFGFFQIIFALFQKIHASYLVFLIIIAGVIAYAYSKFMVNYSDMFWLSALLLFCCGSFYTGFNVMRQIFAASLVALSYKYIFTRDSVKYFIVIILISTIHLSAIFMIPMYFVLTRKWDFQKNRYVKILIIMLVCALFYFFAPSFFNLVSRYMYTEYYSVTAYGVSEGIGILGTLKAFVLACGVIINSKYFNFKNVKERAIYNGCIMYLIIAFCGAKIFIIQRLVHYFVPCLLVAYPHIILNVQNKKRQQFFMALAVILFVLSGINVVLNPTYYFYWENENVLW